MDKELDLVNAIFSAKKQEENIAGFNNALEQFYEIIRKIQISNEIDMVTRLEALRHEMNLVASYQALFSKHIIAVGGGFSAGKSQFINSFLVNATLNLPVRINPTTAIPSYVINGDSQITGISSKFGVINLSEVMPDILERLSHNTQNALHFTFNLKDILPFMIVSAPFSPSLPNNVCFIDTPGYNPASSGKQSEDITTSKEFLQNSQAILWLVATDAQGAGLSSDDLEFLTSLDLSNKKLYIIINKADLRPPNALQEILDHLKETLDSNFIDYEGISVYSAVKKKEYFYDKSSLMDFLHAQCKSKTTKTQEAIIHSFIDIYKVYEKSLKEQKAKIDGIYSALHSIKLDMLNIDEVETPKGQKNPVTSILECVQNIQSDFNQGISKELKERIKDLESRAKSLIDSINALFGREYTHDFRAEQLTSDEIEVKDYNALSQDDDDDFYAELESQLNKTNRQQAQQLSNSLGFDFDIK